MNAVVDQFLTFYTPTNFKWTSMKKVAEKLDWLKLTSQTVAEYLTSQGIGELFIHELVEAASRVNYGQVLIPYLSMSLLACSHPYCDFDALRIQIPFTA